MSASPADVDELLIRLQRALGPARLLVRCETDVLETVYVEKRDHGVVVHDHGRTWLYIANHPTTYAEWSDEVVQRLSDEHQVTIVRERDGDSVIGLQLERELEPTDDPKQVVASVADLLDAIFDAHHIGGGETSNSREEPT
jgi:hypothetical protein